MGIGHFLINQGVLPVGESITEQLEKINIQPRDIDFVIMTHLHTDHASGLRQLKDAKKIIVSADELQDTKDFPIRYVVRTAFFGRRLCDKILERNDTAWYRVK